MGNSCSCPGVGSKANEELRVRSAETVDEAVPQESKDIITSDPKLKEESPAAIANIYPADEEARTESNAEERPSAEPAKEEQACDDAVKEPFQDRAFRELMRDRTIEQAKPGKLPRRPSSENITLEDYTAKHAQLFDKVLALERPEGWILKKEVENVRIYTKEMPGQRLLYFKGTTEMTVEGGVAEAMQKLFKTEDRPKWDEACSHAETPQYFPPLYKYAYAQLLSPAPIISKRDILTLGRFRFEKDGAVVVALHSEELESHPRSSDYVRVNFMEGGYVLRPKNEKGDTVEITWTGLVDPQGWLPTWVANLAVIKQGMGLAKLRSFVLSART